MKNQPIDLLHTPESSGVGVSDEDVQRAPHVRYFPDLIPNHHEVYAELREELSRSKTGTRIEQEYGNRRTGLNMMRRPALHVPAAPVRRALAQMGEGSGSAKHIELMSPVVGMLAGRLWAITGRRPDDAQVCLYEDGRDHCPPHADDATLIGPTLDEQVIGIFSFGSTRRLNFYRMATYSCHPDGRPAVEPDHQLELAPGSLALMHGKTQWYWLHEIEQMETPAPRLSVSAFYYQPRANVDGMPYRLVQRPKSKHKQDPPRYLVTRHVGTPESCLERWDEIRKAEGVPSFDVRELLNEAASGDSEVGPRPRSEDYPKVEEWLDATSAWDKARAKYTSDRIAQAAAEIKIGPDIWIVAPDGREISHRKARRRWGDTAKKDEIPAPPGIDPKVWAVASRLIRDADDDMDA